MPTYTSTTTTATTKKDQPTITITTPLGITTTPTTTKGTTTTKTTTNQPTTTKTTTTQPTLVITTPKPTPYVFRGYGQGYTAPIATPPLDFSQELAQKQANITSQKYAEEQKQATNQAEQLKDTKEMLRRSLYEIKASEPESRWIFNQDNVSVTRSRESALHELERQQQELRDYEESITPKTIFFGGIKTLVPSTTPKPFTHGATLTQEEPMVLAPKPLPKDFLKQPSKEFFEDVEAEKQYNELQQKGNWFGLIGAGFGSGIRETGRFISKIPENPLKSVTDLITGTILFPITTVESAIKKGIPYTFGATSFYLGLGELTGKFGGKAGGVINKLKESKLAELNLMENWKLWDQEFGTKFVGGYKTKVGTEVNPYTRIFRKAEAKTSGVKGITGDLTKVEITAPKGTKLANIGEPNIFAQDIQGITTVGKLKYMKTESIFKGGFLEENIGGTTIVSKKLMVSDIYPMKYTKYTRKVSADILNPKEQLALFGQKVTARKGAVITERVDLFASKLPRAPKARGTGIKIGKTTLPKSRRTPLIFEKPIIELPKNWFKGRTEWSGKLGIITLEATMKKPTKRVNIETEFIRPKVYGGKIKRTRLENLLGKLPSMPKTPPFFAPARRYDKVYNNTGKPLYPTGKKAPNKATEIWGRMESPLAKKMRMQMGGGNLIYDYKTRTGGGFRGIDIDLTGRGGRGREKPREKTDNFLKPFISIGTGIRPTQKPTHRQSFKQQQRQSFRQFTDMITPQRYRPSTRPELIENPLKTTKLKAPKLPPKDEFTKMLTGGRRKQYRIKKKYSPSLTALEFGISGKEPKFLLGTEIRPLIKKGLRL